MSIIIFAVLFPTVVGVYKLNTDPDARLSKTERKSSFRGELKNEH